jgi:LacI family transcriptional regulator, galactose operon repressor
MPGMTKPEAPSAERSATSRWRGPTIRDIARASGVGTATVDRVLNGRGHITEATRHRVLTALSELGHGSAHGTAAARARIAFLTESGISFNQSLEKAVAEYAAAHREVECGFTAVTTAEFRPTDFAAMIERAAEGANGLVIVAREDLAINRTIREVAAHGIPVVCATTDLPNSGRLAYVGSDQASAGGTAAYLMGRVLGPRRGKILLVCSAPYRCQEERELGFRRVLRSEFSQLQIEERVHSNDDVEHTYHSVRKYIQDHGAPIGIYNVAGGNLGIARAVANAGLRERVVFIGHELNANSRMLLESDGMDFVIGHDLDREVALSVEMLAAALAERSLSAGGRTKVCIYTKYSCG